VRERTHPDDRPALATAFQRAAAGDPVFAATFRIERPDGQVRWIEARGETERGSDGAPVRLIGISQDITGRRAAEVQIALGEETLRLATDAAEIGTWDYDLTADVLTWTDRTRAMFGLSPGTPVSMAVFNQSVHPDDLGPTLDAFAAALDPARRASYDVEYRTIGIEDGVLRWVAARGIGLFAGDRCVRAIGTVIDVTRRRQTERAQAFLLDLSDCLRPLGDPDAVIAAAATALGEHLGVNRVGYSRIDDEAATIAIQSPYLDAADPFDGRFSLHDFGVALIDLSRRGETLVVTDTATDGRLDPAAFAAIGTRAFVSVPLVRDARLRASLFAMRGQAGPWADADVALIEAVAQRTWDAVERARAETERQASEAWLRAVIAAVPVGLIFAAADGRITGGNAQTERLVGHPIRLSEGPADYLNWGSFLADGRQIQLDESPLARALAGEERPELEILYRRGDGGRIYLRSVAAPVRGVDEAIVGGVVALLDVDRERRAEEALRELNATLERRVEERTRDLLAAEAALRQAQKMEAVGQLTGGIAHDFNNMLAVVLGSLELLDRRLGDDDARARRYVEAATDGARRAATLTRRLLAFARQQPLQPEPVDVNRLLTGMADLLRGSLGGGTLLETVFSDGLWTVNADPNQLENVILNLGINARDAMAGEGRVTIETANAELDARYAEAEPGILPGQYVMIAVSDTGSGMAPEVVARAFDPFFTTKTVGKGTGLGLSQVYGFVRQSGGHVKIYSEVDHGTTVRLYLPRLVGRGAAAIDPPPVRTAARSSGSELILVVEDDPAVRVVTVEALRELGYRVLEADGAVTALRLLEAHPAVALLFTDIVMPEVNGARLADAARAMRPGLKVLFTTGYTKNAMVHNGVVDPGVDLIGKPFTFEDLAAKVRDILDRP
ncbi:MAG: PAS domain-containing protein, partial [Sphingomonadaceae bacterium]|nr:PAS domain-containing protein [Sphingomonadaceae bacterium]